MDKIYITLGSPKNPKHERSDYDFYATNPKHVEELLEREEFSKDVLEPAVGMGHIAKVLQEHGHNVVGIDIVDRGYPGTILADFTQENFKWKGDIITNPPYKIANQYVTKCMEMLEDGRKLALFLKIQFLESESRRKIFDKYPPKRIYVYSKRAECSSSGDFSKKESSAMCFCWFIWVKGNTDKPTIEWI